MSELSTEMTFTLVSTSLHAKDKTAPLQLVIAKRSHVFTCPKNDTLYMRVIKFELCVNQGLHVSFTSIVN